MLTVLDGPLLPIAERFSKVLAPRLPHDALVIFTRECTGRPRKVAGRPEIVDRVTIAELEAIKNDLGLHEIRDVDAAFGGRTRRLRVIRDATDTLLVILPKNGQTDRDLPEALATWFSMVAVTIRHQVRQASPDYLAESRAASAERARTITQLTELHEATLSSILTTLRSPDIDDRAARIAAGDAASQALIALRAVGDADRSLSEESSAQTFAQIRKELAALLDPLLADVDYVDTSTGDVTLPGEIAQAARTIVRTTALTFIAQPQLSRLRVTWSCDSEQLVCDLRDQGCGDIDTAGLIRQVTGRLDALGGTMDLEALEGWGSRVRVTLPLRTPIKNPEEQAIATLNRRELDVLKELTLGKRNKAIATELGVSESTIKFHVAGVLQKLGAATRAEAGLIGVRAGLQA